MNTQQDTQNDSPTIRQGVDSAINEFQGKASDTLSACDAKIRQSPEKAVLIAAAAGYCLNFMPTGALIAAPVKLAIFLAKPTLLTLGAIKACEIAQNRTKR